jgi:hypothetical protein
VTFHQLLPLGSNCRSFSGEFPGFFFSHRILAHADRLAPSRSHLQPEYRRGYLPPGRCRSQCGRGCRPPWRLPLMCPVSSSSRKCLRRVLGAMPITTAMSTSGMPQPAMASTFLCKLPGVDYPLAAEPVQRCHVIAADHVQGANLAVLRVHYSSALEAISSSLTSARPRSGRAVRAPGLALALAGFLQGGPFHPPNCRKHRAPGEGFAPLGECSSSRNRRSLWGWPCGA